VPTGPTVEQGEVGMFNFKMQDSDGVEVGVYVAAVPGPWPAGTELYEGAGAKWRIVANVTPPDFNYERLSGVWEVEPIRR
jgi:hypothetical protein